ncbi:MAG: class I SAM-dependent methyltransferase, partial [bacterium]
MNLWKRLRRRLEAHPVHTVNPLTGYNRWAPQYSEEDNPIVYLESSALYKMLPDLAGKRVLDVGCGAGRMSKLIAQRGVTYLVGIDFSFYMLCEAQKQLSPLLDTKLVAANVMAL